MPSYTGWSYNFTTPTNTFINWPYRKWAEQEKPVSITSTEQLDALPANATITVTRPGQEVEEWRKRPDDKWMNTKARRGAIASRHFRGAVEGGIVMRGTAGRGPVQAEEEYRWQPGDCWWRPDDDSYLYVIVGPENEANNTVTCQGREGMRMSQQSLQSLRNNSMHRVGAYNNGQPPRATHWAGLNYLSVQALLGISRTEVPESLAEELRAHLLANPNGELLGMFAKHNVDLSVETDAKVDGVSDVKGDELAMILGVNSKMTGSVETPWSAEFKANVVPGCICDTGWEEAIVDKDAFDLNIPEDYKTIEVVLTCPVHPEGQ